MALTGQLYASDLNYIGFDKLLVFNEVWDRVNTAYYDPNFGGRDWEELGEQYRSSLDEIQDVEGFREHLGELLNEIGDSHFAIVPGQLSSSPSESRGNGVIGLDFSWVNNQAIVHRVDRNGAAYKRGLRPGYTILAIDDQPIDEIWSEIEQAKIPERLRLTMVSDAIEKRMSGRPGSIVKLLAEKRTGRARQFDVELSPYAGLRSEGLRQIP